MEILIPIIIVGAIGLVAGIGLAIASVIMSVPVDETRSKLREALPGANCGACGYTGCDAYADALASGEAKPGACTPGGEDTNSALGEILGVEVVASEKLTAAVLCNGTCDNTSEKMDYQGVSTCSGANMLYSGTKACNFACLGFGDCMSVCKFGAVSIKNQKAFINPILCTACGACVKKCPKSIIELVPQKSDVIVFCSNHDKGGVTRKVCTVGCIACKKCEKACEFGAIAVSDNLAKINYDKCTNCGKCVEQCPVHCIVSDKI
ncbi:MAG: RnfABCDGE type electron transport complex subunit B [Oscillospiraceae bacterium]